MTTSTVNVANRGFQRIKRKYESYGSEIINIHDKGFAATTSSTERNLFRGMFATLDKLYDKFNEKWDEAVEYADANELTPTFPSTADETYFEKVKSCYYNANGYHIQVMSIINRSNLLSAESMLNTSNPSAPTSRAILPKIPIRKFHGDLSLWPSFKQLFTSLIKKEPSLSDAERFHYLISYLDGAALGVVKPLPVLGENFEQAWTSLLQVYDNKRKQACVYLDKLLSYKSPTGKPTADTLQVYLAQVTESVISLQNLGITNFAEYLLCELSLRGLDPYTREAFETSIIGTTFPQFARLKEFVQNRCQVLRMAGVKPTTSEFPASSHPAKPVIKSPNSFTPKSSPRPALMAHASGHSKPGQPPVSLKSCFICKGDHVVRFCSNFRSASPSERLELLKQFPGCRNCLHVQHKTNQCTSSYSCRECGGKHHSDLHLSKNPSPSEISPASGQPSNQPGFSGASTTVSTTGVLLGTVIASMCDAQGNPQSIRCVLDPGSQFSFVTEKCVKKLAKSTRPFSGSIAGVNQSPLRNVKGKIALSLLPKHSSTPLETEAVVVPTVTPYLPQSSLPSNMWDDYLTYDLSDPTFTTPGPIDCLIGADLYPEVVTGAPITILADGPRLLETVFGYTVIGRFKGDSDSSQTVALLAHEDLAPLMERFWEVEEPDLSAIPSPDDEECERHFLDTHRRVEDGRYMVSLPFKNHNPNIVPNTKQVMNRLYALESKLAKSEHLKQDYSAFMKEYEELGHMSPASGPASYVIPHHPIYKVNGDDRKLRVVFDASFKTATGNLNDHLHIGPKLQADVTAILLNFRRHSLVFSCDIVKMFRQILVEPNDRKFQQIAWRSDPIKPVQLYELNTITYGLRSSPYLAQRVIRQHALNYQHEFPAAAHILLNNTYVDDIVGGGESPEDLITLKHQLIELLEKGGFQLSKWSTNHPPLLEPDEQSLKQVTLCSGDIPTTKILGMKWDPATDTFLYEVAPPPTGLTKRLILSTIARLFDPLGYIAPVVFYAKCIMQQTWQWKLGWDEEVPQEIGSQWSQFVEQLPQLSSISIPRSFPRTDTSYQFICFSDASEHGFCGAVYLRATNGSNVSMTLVKSKTRLAPTKTLTIPRLELAGALLLAQLIKTLSQLQEDLNITEIYCFTDSMIALSWIKTMPHRLQTYVSNRVQQITAITKIEWWHHIRGSENPADVGSRGTLPSLLRDHHLWWTGPSWCYQPIEQWPISSELAPMELPELRPSHLALVAIVPSQELIEYACRHSSFKRLIRVIAYLKRFVSNARIPKHLKKYRVNGPISSVEFRCANQHYIKLLQHHYFPEVFTGSFNNMSLELRRLNIFLDSEGLARVGGRLSKAPLMPDHKNPILLPSRSYYTNLIIDHFHREGHHIGPTALLAKIRQEYWIPKARNLIRVLRHKCVICTRFSKNPVVPFMGNLPKTRFAAVRPFLITGVDFAGPFLYRETSRRSNHHVKAYLCLFLCMSSRALHLEVATSLSVEGFLDAFDRFSSRRGLPSQMVSDCGTNFQGAARYIQEVYNLWQDPEVQASIVNHTSHLGVQWTFNPPSSPHFGGGWEISVRSVKDLLYKSFGNRPYTLPELCTIFTKVEGILNSRPILPQSSSPDDLETLTPGHFLIGQPITALPEPDLSDIPSNRLNRWQQIRERIQYFWSRWKTEYLSNLQVRQKWTKKSPNLKVGDLVLLLDLNLSPTRWPLGKIIATHPGDDNIVRVVTVKTSHGTYKRPSVKMIPLVLEDIHA